MKKKPKVKTENHDRYIITYADLLTLLLAFFVILYAMSDPNEEKINELGGFFESAFSPRVEKTSIIENDRNLGNRTYGEAVTSEEHSMMKAISEQNNLRKLQREITSQIENANLASNITTNLLSDGLKVTLTNEILFDSGSDKINNEKSIEILKFIGSIVVGFENEISIEGHTDNIPLSKGSKFDSNWELSSARSITVLKNILSGNKELDPRRFSAIGYGEYNPIEPNTTLENKAKNRRVEIMIKRKNSSGLLQPGEGDVNE